MSTGASREGRTAHGAILLPHRQQNQLLAGAIAPMNIALFWSASRRRWDLSLSEQYSRNIVFHGADLSQAPGELQVTMMLKHPRPKISLARIQLRGLVMVAVLATFLSARASLIRISAVQASVRSPQTQKLTVSTSFENRQVSAHEPVEINLNRPIDKSEGRLAVVIGVADLTGLFIVGEKSLRYDPMTLPLPSGESEVTIYLVSPKKQWSELTRLTLRVGNATPEPAGKASPSSDVRDKLRDNTLAPEVAKKEVEQKGDTLPELEENRAVPDRLQTPPQTSDNAAQAPKKRGFDKVTLVPSITLSINSQPAQSNFPESSRPERATFTTLNLQASFKNDLERGPLSSQSQFDFVGSSFQQEALRFGQLGDGAPQIDLSSYLMQFKLGKIRYQSGHYSFGTSRHLMNSFSSRGLMISLPLGKRGDFALSAMNGSSIVGYGNFFGIDKSKHRLLSGTLGVEFLPKRPGGLRFEASGLDGWLLPVNSFSQGSINDAERSRGLGIRLLAADPNQRLKLEGGLARSQSTSPSDPLVNQGTTLEPFPSITRNARYLDASVDVLKAYPVTRDKTVNLTFGFRHERVDPLYRSLGAATQADKDSVEFSLVGAVGEINSQFTHTRFTDNLSRIPSILRSLTRSSTLLVGAPTAALFGNTDKPSPLFPRLSYTLNRTHQFGAGIPVGGGFELNPGSIPDQVGTNQAVSADWQMEKWRVSYRLNHSVQDNRQAGQERQDLASRVNGLTLGISPRASIDLSFDLNAESADNLGAGTSDRTLRFAPAITWRLPRKITAASTLSITLAGDDAETRRNRNAEFDLQCGYQFAFERDRFRKVNGQFFIRYANRYAHTRNNLFALSDLQRTQIVNVGLSFTLF